MQALSSKLCSLPFFQVKHQTPLIQPLTHTTQTKGGDHSICLASSSKGSNSISDLVELPIYPLPLVLFPGAMLPLQISEFRYRIMINTLLQTDHRFGVLFSNPMPSARERFSLQVGCIAEVVKHLALADGRFFIICKGQVCD
jgi:ATP-dependent protease La (LON) substrate-binding domain